jgi:hypothetical protein
MSEKHDAYTQVHLYPESVRILRKAQSNCPCGISLTKLVNQAVLGFHDALQVQRPSPKTKPRKNQ